MTADPQLVAAAATSWEALASACRACTACSELAETRTNVVPGICPEGADVLLVGEAPGAQEDALGRTCSSAVRPATASHAVPR
jgi:DNA polymerase